MHCNAVTLSQNIINVLGKYLCFELCYHTGPNRWLGEHIADSAQDLEKFLNKELTKVSQWFIDNEVNTSLSNTPAENCLYDLLCKQNHATFKPLSHRPQARLSIQKKISLLPQQY